MAHIAVEEKGKKVVLDHGEHAERKRDYIALMGAEQYEKEKRRRKCLIMKDKEFFNIIIQHKIHVVEAGIRVANAFFNEDQKLAMKILRNCFSHDNRKMKIAREFMHLRSTDSERFQDALNSHRKRSPHHLQYWKDTQNMPPDVIAEMMCDW